ncbi:MAG: DUF3618 domain-containing protein [Nocardioidaceae bacterium]
MGQSPEELREEIERTRQDLSRDVDLINEKVSPQRIVQRRVDKTKTAVGSIRERVMGTASSGTSAIGDKASAIGDKASAAQSSVSDAVGAVGGAPDAARRQAEGNPLAAGLVAFGAGMLIASLLPASQAEQNAAVALQDKASDLKEPLKEEMSQIANDLKDDMQAPAQAAVQSLRDTATDAVQTVQEQGKSSAQTVTSEAKDSSQEVRDSSGS